MTRFVWLRQFEPGSNSADANRLLERCGGTTQLCHTPENCNKYKFLDLAGSGSYPGK